MGDWIQIGRDLTLAFLGGLVGSAGGAWGAQRIVEKSTRKKELLLELRNTNALIQLCFSACNAALQFRENFSKELAEELKKDREAFKYSLGIKLQPGDEYYLQMNFRKSPVPVVSVAAIQEVLHSKISALGRTLAAASELASSVEGLNNMVAERDKLLERFSDGAIPADQVQFLYLGLRSEGAAGTDERYPDVVDGIDLYAQNIAFFSYILCKDLIVHGNRVRGNLLSEFKKIKDVPIVSTVSFEIPIQEGLMPDEKLYEKWLGGFKQNITH